MIFKVKVVFLLLLFGIVGCLGVQLWGVAFGV